MSKADNYNKYDYDQTSGEKHTGQRQYTVRSLVTRSGSEVYLQSRDQRFDTRRLMREDK